MWRVAKLVGMQNGNTPLKKIKRKCRVADETQTRSGNKLNATSVRLPSGFASWRSVSFSCPLLIIFCVYFLFDVHVL